MVPTSAKAAEGFSFMDGDRVVLLGNALIEREQRYGYWETLLTLRHPDKNITFRNLGWSGDTVFGHARAGFGTTADGFRHLEEHVISLKPTVILVGYGLNEAFEGEGGLPRFVKGLEVLLDTLAQTKARIVLLSPLRQEDLGRPLPDPTTQNKNIHLYADAMAKVAAQRGYLFVDLYQLLGAGTKTAPLTDNGIHLTAYGYWRSAAALERGLGLTPQPGRIEIKANGKSAAQKISATLPMPPAPVNSPQGASLPEWDRIVQVKGLAPGKYALLVDGKSVALADASAWVAGVKVSRGPEFDQVESLRTVIMEKNRLYFHRWRPQNETYLFGFRKHEQGQNAVEIPQFDPLVAKREAKISRLRVPVPHEYQLVKQPEKGK